MRVMKKNKYSSYSSFWMDKSLFEDEFDGVESVSSIERKSSDIMKLVSYKRSIANFVSIVTGQSIPVRFEDKVVNPTVLNVIQQWFQIVKNITSQLVIFSHPILLFQVLDINWTRKIVVTNQSV